MVCLASATNLLTAMSLDRYQVIVKPMESLRERPRVLLKIAVAWALSLVFPIPQLFIFVQYDNGLKVDGTARHVCGSKGYTSSWQRKAYFTFTTTYILIIPMAIMVYCYMNIIHVVWVRANMTALQFKSSQKRRSFQNNHHSSGMPDTTSSSSSSTTAAATAAAAAATTTTITTPTHSIPIPLAKKSASLVTGSGHSSSCVTNDNGEDDRKRGLSTTTRVIGRPVHIHVKWASNERNSSRGSSTNAEYSNSQEQCCLSAAGQNGNNGLKKYGSSRVSARRNLMASKRRVLIMTLTVVVSFLVCLTPYFFFSLLRIYSDYQLKFETTKVISEFMVMIHSALNPLLYGLFSLRKHHLKYIFPILFCFKKSGRNREGGRDVKEMQCLGRRKAKSRWRDCDHEISSSGPFFDKQLGDSPRSISCASSSSSSVPSKPSKSESSQTQTKEKLFPTIAFSGNTCRHIQCEDINSTGTTM